MQYLKENVSYWYGATQLAKQISKFTTTPKMLNFVCHYLVLNYHIRLYAYDMYKGVIPNKRISIKQKADYVSETLLFIAGEEVPILEGIRNPMTILKDKFQIGEEYDCSEGIEYTQNFPEYYYQKLPLNREDLTNVLAICLMNHANFGFFPLKFATELEFKDDKSQWEKAKFHIEEFIEKQFIIYSYNITLPFKMKAKNGNLVIRR